MDNRQPLKAGTVVGGDYRIEKVLGAGGFGITYLALDEKLDTQVALKEYFPATLAYRSDGITIQPAPSEGGADYEWGLERFLAEAQTLARLRHPNIVRVSRYFRENETAYMVLGFVQGEDFEAWLGNLVQTPTQAQLDAITLPMLAALETVHAAQLVHRDVKPQNIFIRSEDSEPILLDFGAARQALSEHSRATAAFVSPGYSPSESHLNDPTNQGPWTDIYAMAATLYRALVGRPPAQVLSRVSHDNYVPLARQLPNATDYRSTFLNAIDDGLNMRREDRPQSVAAWRERLFSDPGDVATLVSAADATLVEAANDDTELVAASTRIETAGGRSSSNSRTRQQLADTVVEPPAGNPAPQSKLVRWGITLAAIAVGISGVVQIYQSFQTPGPTITTPSPTRKTTSSPRPAAPPATRPTTPPATQPATNPLDRMGADKPPANGTLFANDPSLRRIATTSWHSGGFQNGFWTGVTTGSKGTGIFFKCRGTNDVRRNSIVELELIPTGDRPLAGSHQVTAQIGTYSTNASLNFNSGNGFSTGGVTISETAQDAGRFLNFLHQVFIGASMTLSIPSINYQETVSLNGAEEALRPCFGADIAQPWRAYQSSQGVSGGEIRNADGGVLLVRCDKTAATRGNSVVLFSIPFNGAAIDALHNVSVTIGDTSFAPNFHLRRRGNNLTGVLYHRVTNSDSRQNIRTFLAQLRQSNQLSISSANPRFSTAFSLRGSSAALSGCSDI